ncbi:unnamed protein product (macronuclear) [Paramecium tetraurelia]|uniref:Uncharacterized protein n=1 Tax=Paramecium tetraurelia TaxID=5888 RepID=A0EA42_PARTE|nr:uncharacterized protein GSPATT00024891001 [Paramecium tetraurelia]CAK92159.1 unnamed protein product [Paramecium tetraurelia]|eukprot:XP_001459556.1 hypothetical protein (macronuclear) [Paramecium tetraurelia strain d4-2]
MNISVSFARQIKDFRFKNTLFGVSSLVGLCLCGKMFVLDHNSFYQLIYISELIIGFFMMLIVLFNQLKDLDSVEYVFTMGYLIKESEGGNVQYTFQELEEMIKARSMGEATTWRLLYTSIKMDFHHFCCESKDFLYLVLSAGVITSYFFESRFQSNSNSWLVFLLFFVTVWDFVFVALGFIIELPRRIRQEYKLRALQRRATRQQILDIIKKVQIASCCWIMNQWKRSRFINHSKYRKRHNIDTAYLEGRNNSNAKYVLNQCWRMKDFNNYNAILRIYSIPNVFKIGFNKMYNFFYFLAIKQFSSQLPYLQSTIKQMKLILTYIMVLMNLIYIYKRTNQIVQHSQTFYINIQWNHSLFDENDICGNFLFLRRSSIRQLINWKQNKIKGITCIKICSPLLLRSHILKTCISRIIISNIQNSSFNL